MSIIHQHTKGDEPNHPHHRDQPSGWYFWDETWADRVGPYASRSECEAALASYTEVLNHGPSQE